MERETNSRGVKLTIVAPGELQADIERHRRDLEARTGLMVSTSQALGALVRAGLRVAEDKVTASN
jgi:hypothetical protein